MSAGAASRRSRGIGSSSAPPRSPGWAFADHRWRDQLEPAEKSEGPPPQNSRESSLRKEVSQLKRVLAEKTLELDFFKGALQKIEARRQQSDGSGAKASTTKSGK